MKSTVFFFPLVFLFMILQSETLLAQPSGYRPGLFFREDWKDTPAEIPLSQKHVANPDLIVTLYGAGADSLKKSHHPTPPDDPFYVWSGLFLGNWMVTLKHKTSNVDLSGFAKVIWRSKQAGFRQLRITLKLADGTWLVSDQNDGPSKDWHVMEFNIQDITWYKLDPKFIYETKPAASPDLCKVEEIGFTDLMYGGKSDACSRLDWIEVYGNAVNRK